YNDTFLKLDPQKKLSTSNKSKQLQELEKEQAQVLKNDQNAKNQAQGKVESSYSLYNPFTWFGGTNKTEEIVQPIQKNILTTEEQESTILVLQQTIVYLKNPEIMNLITPEKAFSLLIAADTLLINYTKINGNIGKMPQVISLISEMKDLSSSRLA